jgi:hypothetical protein
MSIPISHSQFEDDWSDPAWPPGTVRLELLKTGYDAKIILLPRPTLDPNDPLNWPKWRKYVFKFGNSELSLIL